METISNTSPFDNFEFKSYYVVWKLQNENDENDIGRSSLNRTM